MNLVDTHCHIQSIGTTAGEAATRLLWAKAEFSAAQVVDNALKAGIVKLICVGCDVDDSRLAVDFAQRFDSTYSAIGIHPHEAKHHVANALKLKEFSDLVSEEKVVAVGECGLDYYYKHSEPKEQAEILHFQLELAHKHNLPVIFHMREAFDDFWPIFEQYPKTRGVLHSFTDNQDNLERALGHGLYIGVNGIATFAREPNKQQLFKRIPENRLLLETDSPFLTPTPYRGTINEPKHIATIVRYLAELRGEDVEALATITTDNARLLFAL